MWVNKLKKKIHFLTEESFSKIVYDILLRIDHSAIDTQIYQTIENYIFYINMHLKILRRDSGRIEMNKANIIGYDFLFEIFCNTKNEKVAESCLKCLMNILKTQLNFRGNLATNATFFYYRLVVGKLEAFYEELARPEGMAKVRNLINFLSEIITEVIQSKNQIFNGVGLVEMITVMVCDKVL